MLDWDAIKRIWFVVVIVKRHQIFVEVRSFCYKTYFEKLFLA